MLNYKPTTETFAIGSSLNKAVFLTLIHLVGLFACWQNSLAVDIRLILLGLISVSLFIRLSDYNEIHYKGIRLTEVSGWELALKDKVFVPITLGKASVITPWVMFLYCETGQKQWIIVVFSDALSGKEYRRLSALVRTSGL
ncbi:protein YgfX [Methylomarinum vadi]|uniref:protein YgfX n=1 Tax=Methylomarinum vadi TaxID=438855 RepID=UPI0012679F4A|nr:protein YgfX [Methylomarinum vadi]